MNRTRIKVCCIQSVDEAHAAIRAGADALGLVSAMPSGPGPIDEALIAYIGSGTPPPVVAVLLTALETAAEIADQVRRTRASVVQIVREIDPREHELLARRLPGLRRIQVVHVEDANVLERARRYHGCANALLLDSGAPGAAVPRLGGTGRVHDWWLSRQVIAQSPLPVFLAGGLNPDNVAEAIETIRPYAVDVCSGLRPKGDLDRALLGKFVQAVREADVRRVRPAGSQGRLH